MAADFKVGFCISGQGRLFRAAADHAARLGIRPALVVAESKASPDLEEFCRMRNIAFVRLPVLPRPQFDEEILQRCAGAKLDLLSLTFDKLIPAALVRQLPGKIINVHPALLPAFKGMHALQQVAEAGVSVTGATIHEVDEQMDHGPIIAQCVVGLGQGETADSIGKKIFPLLQPMYLQVLAWFAAGRVVKDAAGRLSVRDAVYGRLPVSPALEAPWKTD
jgi:phosphoribosylglycinamide formyltransferase 1